MSDGDPGPTSEVSGFTGSFADAIDEPWIYMEPLRLGSVPAAIRAADVFVCIEHEGTPLLRVDLFAEPEEYRCFECVQCWQDRVVIGWGEHVWLIWPDSRKHRGIGLHGAYFSGLETDGDRLYVASSERVLRVAPDGWVHWVSEPVGIDGVLIHRVTPTVVEGDGERDPPGGWVPFALSAGTGDPIAAE